MKECMNCENCQQGENMYYCTAKNEFVINEGIVIEKNRTNSGWKKGDPEYERRRRQIHKGDEFQKIG